MPTFSLSISRGSLSVDINQLIYYLVHIYAFLIPFETVLEFFFGIDTVFKPYRVLAILIILVYTAKAAKNFSIGRDIQEDLFLYAVIAYGLFITLFQMVASPFSIGKFFNDIFQLGLYLGVFFVIKNCDFSMSQFKKIFRSLTIGITLNAVYAYYNFFVLKEFERQSGFMDNPNYFAFSLLAGLTFLLLYFRQKKLLDQAIVLAAMGLLATVFIVAGSRTCLFIFLLISVYIFLVQPLRQKIIIGFFVLVIAITGAIRTNIIENSFNGPFVLFDRLDQSKLTGDVRLDLWKGIVQISSDTYFVGLGIGQFKTRFSEFFRQERSEKIYRMVLFGYFLTPHSDYFAILIEYGIIGLIAYGIFLFLSLRKGVLQFLSSRTRQQQKLHQLKFAMLIALLLFGISHDNFGSAIYWFLIAYATKTIIATQQFSNLPTQSSSPQKATTVVG